MTVEEYAADLVARFEAMAELDRERERDARLKGMPNIAAMRSTSAHDWMLAAKMVRKDIARRARRVARCGRAA